MEEHYTIVLGHCAQTAGVVCARNDKYIQKLLYFYQ